jgi:hypothetical protein
MKVVDRPFASEAELYLLGVGCLVRISLCSAFPVVRRCYVPAFTGISLYICADIPTSHGFWGTTRSETEIASLDFTVLIIIIHLCCCHINCWHEVAQNSALYLLVWLMYWASVCNLSPMLNPVCSIVFLMNFLDILWQINSMDQS